MPDAPLRSSVIVELANMRQARTVRFRQVDEDAGNAREIALIAYFGENEQSNRMNLNRAYGPI
jgi:hypothetical protein